MKSSWIIGIIILAVLLGYLTAWFVIGPIIGYDADESPTKIAGQTDEDQDKEKDQDKDKKDSDKDKNADADQTVNAAPTEGYALQFGAFSTKEAAEKLAETLESQGIQTEIVEIDSVYKVISPVVDTKDKALDELDKLAEKEVTDVFVATF